MSTFIDDILHAHGGLDRWRRFTTVQAKLLQGGALWGLKGKAGILDDTAALSLGAAVS